MNPSVHHKRYQVHQAMRRKVAEMVATLTLFVMIFSGLMTFSNWSAYSKIVQAWFEPVQEEQMTATIFPSSDPEAPDLVISGSSETVGIEAMGAVAPPDMRLEIPGVFEGSVPVVTVNEEGIDFAQFYDTENSLQEAMQSGVVHYPFTADPDEYGNVFITGHSSNYAWAGGTYNDVFALLHVLELGDEYVVIFEGKRHTYRVVDEFEIQPHEMEVLSQPVDQRLSTLMTCTPVGTTLRRLIVQGELVRVD